MPSGISPHPKPYPIITICVGLMIGLLSNSRSASFHLRGCPRRSDEKIVASQMDSRWPCLRLFDLFVRWRRHNWKQSALSQLIPTQSVWRKSNWRRNQETKRTRSAKSFGTRVEPLRATQRASFQSNSCKNVYGTRKLTLALMQRELKKGFGTTNLRRRGSASNRVLSVWRDEVGKAKCMDRTPE